MNKHLTVAALLVAGTAFANAETTKTVDLSFSSSSWSGGTTIDLTSPSLSVPETGWALDSWELSFDVSIPANSSVNQWGSTILATGSDGYAVDYTGGFQIRWNNGTDNNNKDGKIFVKYGSESNKLFLNNNQALDFSTEQSLSFVVKYDYATKTLSAKLGEGDFVDQVVSQDVIFTQLTTTGVASGSVVSAPDEWNYSNLKGTLTYSSIPEPSAFGLLAGLGALALAASRRRRKKA